MKNNCGKERLLKYDEVLEDLVKKGKLKSQMKNIIASSLIANRSVS